MFEIKLNYIDEIILHDANLRTENSVKTCENRGM